MSEAVVPYDGEFADVSPQPRGELLAEIARLNALNNQELSPIDEGLVVEEGGRLELYASSRVASWNSKGVEEANVVRIKSMYDLTAEGAEFEAQLANLDAAGLADLPQKIRSAWRIRHTLMRKLSVDHIPELLYNVFGVQGLTANSPQPLPDLMQMSLVGPSRPLLRSEIVLNGDNSNDHYNHALEDIARQRGFKNREQLHWRLGELYRGSFFSPATAEACRQLVEVEDYRTVVTGILDFHEIEQLSPGARFRAKGRIAMQSMAHVIRGTDAS